MCLETLPCDRTADATDRIRPARAPLAPFGFVQIQSRCSLIEVSDVIGRSPAGFLCKENPDRRRQRKYQRRVW